MGQDDNLSSSEITLRVLRYLLRFREEYDLAPDKDLAVSFPLSYLYGGTKPATLRLGFPDPFEPERFCSHL